MTEYSDNLTPDQYRREGAEAMRKAALYQCVRVPAELPGSPRMAFELGLYSCESAIRALDVDEVLAWLPPAPDAVARLVEAVKAVVLAYQKAYPMRTADMHPAECDCLRCKIDWLDHVSVGSASEARHD